MNAVHFVLAKFGHDAAQVRPHLGQHRIDERIPPRSWKHFLPQRIDHEPIGVRRPELPRSRRRILQAFPARQHIHIGMHAQPVRARRVQRKLERIPAGIASEHFHFVSGKLKGPRLKLALVEHSGVPPDLEKNIGKARRRDIVDDTANIRRCRVVEARHPQRADRWRRRAGRVQDPPDNGDRSYDAKPYNPPCFSPLHRLSVSTQFPDIGNLHALQHVLIFWCVHIKGII